MKPKKLSKREIVRYTNLIDKVIRHNYHRSIISVNVIANVIDLPHEVVRIFEELHSKHHDNNCEVSNNRIKLSIQSDGDHEPKYVHIQFFAANEIKQKLVPFNHELHGTVCVNMVESEIDKVLVSVKSVLTSWVGECLTYCVKERPRFSIIVIPPGLVISDIVGSFKDNGIWTRTIYDESVELVNESRGYIIVIMTISELERMVNSDSAPVDKCFVHHLHDNKVRALAEAITINDIMQEEHGPEVIDIPAPIGHIDVDSDCDVHVSDQPPIPVIVDSGNEHRSFESGFKRDSDIDKAKWSLLPPFTWSALIPGEVGKSISYFLLTGNVTELESALQSLVKVNGVEPMCARYHGGAEKYGYFNWAQLAPLSVFMDSLGRHLWALTDWGAKTEDPESKYDHIGAVMWNLSCMIHLVTLVKDGHANKTLMDIPPYLNLVR